MTAMARNAVRMESPGARLNSHVRLRACALPEEELDAVGHGCRRPNGPTRFIPAGTAWAKEAPPAHVVMAKTVR
jgi:hypothetical protein